MRAMSTKTRYRLSSFLFFLAAFFVAYSPLAHAGGKDWSLYSWVDDDGWNYSLVRATDQHPDAAAVKTSATHSLEAIKTRMSLLTHGSQIELNPLPVLNLELHLPPGDTVQEFERVCKSSQVTLVH
jgi:hypothetical protein